ncbi:MAG: phospholipase D-like domain-containing protein [Candidatus Bathyarchaeia archaeon]
MDKGRVAIIFGVICVILAAGLFGVVVHYTMVIRDKDALIISLQSQNSIFQAQKDMLQAWLDGNKTLLSRLEEWLQGNITYYESQIELLNHELNKLNQSRQELYINYTILTNAGLVFNGLKINNLEVKSDYDRSSILGDITNISGELMDKVYVILFIFNANGSLYNYQVRTIENLAFNETKSFEFSHVLEKNQTFRVFAVGSYGFSDIENDKIMELLSKVEELNVTIEQLNAEIRDLEKLLNYRVYILADQAYYYSVRADLQRANKSILIAMYSMIYDKYYTPPDWANDLIEELIYAKRRGVNVKVIIEYRTYSGFLDDNLWTRDYLFSNNVSVKLDDEPDTDHLKLVIIDDKIIYIGSHDWNDPSLFSNHEISVKILSEKLAQELREYVEATFK